MQVLGARVGIFTPPRNPLNLHGDVSISQLWSRSAVVDYISLHHKKLHCRAHIDYTWPLKGALQGLH